MLVCCNLHSYRAVTVTLFFCRDEDTDRAVLSYIYNAHMHDCTYIVDYVSMDTDVAFILFYLTSHLPTVG